MKRGTPEHPKVKRLAKLLEISRCHAIGIVEGLFHFTIEHAPQGNVGKWTDEEIADGIGWDMDKLAAAALMRTLVEAGWLDEDSDHRLLVHDWAEHADRGVRMRLQNKGLCLLGAHNSTTGAQNGEMDTRTGARMGAQYKTTTTTAPTTEPAPTAAEGRVREITSADHYEVQPHVARAWADLPARVKQSKVAIGTALIAAVRERGADPVVVVDRLLAYYDTPQGRGEYFKLPQNFIAEGMYEADVASFNDRKPKRKGLADA